ncbi:hypothetical protein ODJ79_20725 [Actinoplanes sp. KI2]|nr:hypothetical protein [Actinoplanes sp. KI2]MCU7726158.1 hypothetical protein [Actinoplanes sp. KI2]
MFREIEMLTVPRRRRGRDGGVRGSHEIARRVRRIEERRRLGET